MRYLITTTLLALAPLCWAEHEIEWPLELTCITPGEIFQLHLTGQPKTSWAMPLLVTDGRRQPFKEEDVLQKLYKIEEIQYSPHNVRILQPSRGLTKNGNYWVISRYTMQLLNGVNGGAALRAAHGSCELGLLGLDAFQRKF